MLTIFKKDSNFATRTENGVTLRYCKTNNFFDIKFTQKLYQDKFHKTDKTCKMKDVSFNKWLKSESSVDVTRKTGKIMKGNNSKTILAYFDHSFIKGDIIQEDLLALMPVGNWCFKSEVLKKLSNLIGATGSNWNFQASAAESDIDVDEADDESEYELLDESDSEEDSDEEEPEQIITIKNIPKQVKIDYMIRRTSGTNKLKYYVHHSVAFKYLCDISPKFAMQVYNLMMQFMTGDMTLINKLVETYDLINDTDTHGQFASLNGKTIAMVNSAKKGDYNSKISYKLLEKELLEAQQIIKGQKGQLVEKDDKIDSLMEKMDLMLEKTERIGGQLVTVQSQLVTVQNQNEELGLQNEELGLQNEELDVQLETVQNQNVRLDQKLTRSLTSRVVFEGTNPDKRPVVSIYYLLRHYARSEWEYYVVRCQKKRIKKTEQEIISELTKTRLDILEVDQLTARQTPKIRVLIRFNTPNAVASWNKYKTENVDVTITWNTDGRRGFDIIGTRQAFLNGIKAMNRNREEGL
jgi:hypothetical protein